MFERYNESARRVLFFSRCEAAERGVMSIEAEHFLLGLVREGRGVVARLFESSGAVGGNPFLDHYEACAARAAAEADGLGAVPGFLDTTSRRD